MNLIKGEIYNSRNPIPDPLDQTTVDYYAGLLGYSPGYLTLNQVNDVISQYGLATDEGIEAVLDQYQLSGLAKLTLKDISDGAFYEDLNQIPGFSDLNISEKEIIEAANIFVSESQQRSCGVGAFIGFVIGSFIFPPATQIIGVIVGCGLGK